MERSIKARSLGDHKPTTPHKSRPVISERHKSAPLAEQRRQLQIQANRLSDSTTSPTSSFTQRLSKLSVKDSPPSSNDSSPPPSRSSTFSQSEQNTVSKSPKVEEDALINLLVIGNEWVGKSQFVSNILDLRRAVSSPISLGKASIGRKIYKTQFVELLLDDVDFNNGVHWPRFVNGQKLPSADGVFLLYDASDMDTVAEVPPALTALTLANLPCMLVATRRTSEDQPHALNARFQAQVRQNCPSVTISEAHLYLPESPKQNLLLMMNQIVGPSQASSRVPSPTIASPRESRRPSIPSLSKNRSTSTSRSRSHSRLRMSKSREMLSNFSSKLPIFDSTSKTDTPPSEPTIVLSPSKMKLSLNTKQMAKLPSRTGGPHTPASSEDNSSSQQRTPLEVTRSAIPQTPESFQMRNGPRPGTSDTNDSKAHQTFLNMDESSSSEDTEEEPFTLPMTKTKSESPSKTETGVSFPDLVDKLLSFPVTKQDSKLVPSFLCLFRLFATPRQLLVAVIERYRVMDLSDANEVIKTGELGRYLQILSQWTALYPGDFAPTPIHQMAVAFAQGVEKNKYLAPTAREIGHNLETLALDIDTNWAYEGPPARQNSFRQLNRGQNRSGPNSQPVSRSQSGDLLQMKTAPPSLKRENSYQSTEGDNNSSARTSTTSASLTRSGNKLSQSYTNIAQLEQARLNAQKFDPRPHIRLGKVQWHQFIDTPIEELAQEITRIDWTMYSAIRPRDYVRHVSLSSEQRKRLGTDDNISMMVKHFNHLALFVSGMILLRDKPKHRAIALAKFMALAKEVRQLNNYNSLGAIVAGVTGHEIARLTATRELIPADLHKQFLSLTVLMSTSRSHATYRMAWENTSTERIPFVPLLRQDLTMAASANQTFTSNGNINWKKFEIMGDVIVGIQKSLQQPYSFFPASTKSEEVLRLIIETKIVDESQDSTDPRDELYERSTQVEPPVSAEPRKKFEWRRK